MVVLKVNTPGQALQRTMELYSAQTRFALVRQSGWQTKNCTGSAPIVIQCQASGKDSLSKHWIKVAPKALR